MRTCKLIRITCHKENEYASDEPYIVVQGKRVWSAEGVDKGESREINLEFRFTRELRVRLYEADLSIRSTKHIRRLRFLTNASTSSDLNKYRRNSPWIGGSS